MIKLWLIKYIKKLISFSWICLFILFLLFGHESFSQSLISGKISSITSQKPLANAIITLTRINSNATIAYGLSKSTGEFEIKTKTLDDDSLLLQVRMLGYSPKTLSIANKTQNIEIMLEETAVELKEVKVTQEPIKKFGDTLSYSVAAFKDKNDRVIADIIKKLPGIEISPNGQIFYQGMLINKYYIEGMDLLEGRYKLANDNLNVEAVTNVEVIENHQPIRILDSLVFSNRAALNIKLKKNVTTTGQMSIGAGLAPLLWDINLTPMLFTKQTQSLITYQANNIGKNSSSQLIRLTPGTYDDALLNVDNKNDRLGIQQLNTPPFKETRWLDNNSHMGSLNILKRLKKGLELRLIGDYLYDIQKQQGYTKTQFFNSGDSSIELLENKVNKLYFNSFKSDLTLQKNVREKYLKNSLKFKAFWDKQTGIITNADNVLIQQLRNPFFSVLNDYKDIFKIGKYLVTLNSSIGFEKAPQKLAIIPGQFIELLNNQNPFDKISQDVLQTGFHANNFLQFTQKVKTIVFDSQIGVILEKQNLKSTITLDDGGVSQKTDKDFSNNLDYLHQKYYINIRAHLKRKKFNVYLATPINFNVFNIQDKNIGKKQNLSKTTFEPRILANWEVNKFWNLNLTSTIQNSFGDINQIYYGYIMTSYREIKRTDTPLLQAVNYNNSVGWSYRNPVNATFGNLSYSYNIQNKNILVVNTINQNGSMEQNAILQPNRAYSQSLNAGFGKYFREIKTSVAPAISVSSQKNLQIINDKYVQVTNNIFNPTFRISSSFLGWFNSEYYFKLTSIKSKIATEQKQNIIQQTHEVRWNFNVKDLYMGISNEFYINSYNNTQNLFADIILRKTIGARKIDIEAIWTNIFNTKSLINLTNGTFNYIETNYNLRPSQLLVRARLPL